MDGRRDLALTRKLGDQAGVAAALLNLGVAALRQNELEEALTLQRELEDPAGVARSLQALSLAAVHRDHEQAHALFEEGLALAQETRKNAASLFTLLTSHFVRGTWGADKSTDPV